MLTASVAIITLLILLQEQFEKNFSENIEGVDLVLGAQGSPLQLILSSVYQVDAPTGNIDYSEAKTWMRNPMVKTAIPLAFGDNYHGYRIVGTTPQYLDKFGARLQDGKVFANNFDVVIGSSIAEKMQLKIGDKFFGSHGDAEEGEVHENHAYVVTGIASKTGKVVDNLILCNIQSVWAMHDHEHAEGEAGEVHEHEGEATATEHDHEGEAHAGEEGVEHNDNDGHEHGHEEAGPHDEEQHGHNGSTTHAEEANDHESEETISEEGKEITAVLIKFKGPRGIALWPRIVAMNTKMQAASPAIEINRLFSLFGIGLQALQYMAYGIMFISGISIFIALYNTLKERKYEFALLRVNGASRFQLLALVLIESLLLCIVGFVFGTIVGRLALMLISGSSEDEFKMSFNPLEIVWEKESYLFLITIFVGILAAVIPAVKAYSLNISKTLANA